MQQRSRHHGQQLPVPLLILSLAIALVACAPETQRAVAAHQAEAQEPADDVASPSVAPSTAGSRAFIDAETGQLTSAPQGSEIQSARDPLAFSSRGLAEEVLPDGTVKVDLQGRFRSGVYAKIGDDGEVQIEHGPAPATADSSDEEDDQ